METQNCIVTPKENGTELDVVCGSQHLARVQYGIAKVLGIPENAIHVTARRIGGAFGAKISREAIQ